MNPKPSISPWNIIIEVHLQKEISKPKLAQEVMATVFWDTDGVIHMDFLEHEPPSTHSHYNATLKTLK
jgi:hypothetical protein